MNPEIEVAAAAAEDVRLPLPLERVEAAVRHVLESEGISSAEISVAFLNDAEIARLNEGYLEHEGATDVISFALHAAGERPLGDVYIGVQQADRQSAEVSVPVEEELLRLTVHGTLHVLGYDHPAEGDRERTPMYLRQEELLTSFLERIRATGR